MNVGITGMGIVASIADDVPSFRQALREGRSGIKKSLRNQEPAVTVDIAAEIAGFSFPDRLARFQDLPAEKLQLARRLGQRAPFAIGASIIAALEAWKQAQLFDQHTPSERKALIVAGQNTTQNYQYELIPKFRKNPEYLSPRYALEFLETNQVGVLSELFEIKGEGLVVGGASATGNVGIIKGCQLILAGLADVCLVAGVVADLSPMDVQGFINIGAMGGKRFIDQPQQACRPFDARHEGFIYGQAGACIVLESASSASRRGVPGLAAVKGAALNLDGNSSSNPDVAGEERAMRAALSQAGLPEAAVNYLNTHGSSSPLGDETEAEAISRVFNDHMSGVWLNSTKSLTGHCLYSAGLVEAIATVEQMKGGFLHPNKNLDDPIHKDLRFCGDRAIDHQIDIAMSNSFGFGGINTAIVLENIKK